MKDRKPSERSFITLPRICGSRSAKAQPHLKFMIHIFKESSTFEGQGCSKGCLETIEPTEVIVPVGPADDLPS